MHKNVYGEMGDGEWKDGCFKLPKLETKIKSLYIEIIHYKLCSLKSYISYLFF